MDQKRARPRLLHQMPHQQRDCRKGTSISQRQLKTLLGIGLEKHLTREELELYGAYTSMQMFCRSLPLAPPTANAILGSRSGNRFIPHAQLLPSFLPEARD